MKIPRDLSGHDLVRALCRDWSYRVVHQEGSHIVLEIEIPSHQRIVVPAHRQLRLGTLSAILRSVAGAQERRTGGTTPLNPVGTG